MMSAFAHEAMTGGVCVMLAGVLRDIATVKKDMFACGESHGGTPSSLPKHAAYSWCGYVHLARRFLLVHAFDVNKAHGFKHVEADSDRVLVDVAVIRCTWFRRKMTAGGDAVMVRTLNGRMRSPALLL